MGPGCSWKCVQEERLPHGESSLLHGLSRGLPFLASVSLFNCLVWVACLQAWISQTPLEFFQNPF